MAREDTTRATLTKEFATTVEYRGSDLYAQFVRLLDAIDDCYREEMLTVTPENLRYKQGAAAQVRALRNQLVNPSVHDIPKI